MRGCTLGADDHEELATLAGEIGQIARVQPHPCASAHQNLKVALEIKHFTVYNVPRGEYLQTRSARATTI